MEILNKIRRHAAVASGNFCSMLRGVEIPPLPAVTSRLIAEINQPTPDTARLVKVISTSPQLSAKVIRTVNSSRFALRNRVVTVRHAFALLGLRHVRAIALSYAAVAAVPKPENAIFDQQAFWTDCLLRAMLARAFARKHNTGEEAEEAFTAMLLADVAVPVLLTAWHDYYMPVMEHWRKVPKRLSQIERDMFKWDHSQAGAWILRSWGFPDDVVCFVGAHNLSPDEIRELDLGETIALPIATASLVASVLRPYKQSSRLLVRTAIDDLSIPQSDLANLFAELRVDLAEAQALFDLESSMPPKALEDLVSLVNSETDEEVT